MSVAINSAPIVIVGDLKPSEATAALSKQIDDRSTLLKKRPLGPDQSFTPAAPATMVVTESGRDSVGSVANFSLLTGSMRKLRELAESDDFGALRASPRSIKLATQILFPLIERGLPFPAAVDVSTDHDGELRIVWENGPRFLELVVPREVDEAPYFYYSQGKEYDLQRDMALGPVLARFQWLGFAEEGPA